MPLPPPVDREPVHQRQIEMRAYRRADGLYDIEAHLVDTKAHPFQRALPGPPVPAGESLHDLSLRLVIDEFFTVHDVVACADATPFGVCREAPASLAAIKGTTIGPGWNRTVRERLGGAASCTHLVELLAPLATVAIQALVPVTRQRPVKTRADGRPVKVDSCYAYASHREVVRQLWPQWHTATAKAAGPTPD